MQDPQRESVGFGAKCAVHPDRVASRTCSRCGNFTCDECNVSGTEVMCPTCRNLIGAEAFPYTRSSFSFDGIWGFTFERWKTEWVMLSVCVLILIAVGFAVAMFNVVFQGIAGAVVGKRGGSSGAAIITSLAYLMSQVVSTLVQGVFQMGLYRIYIDVLSGRKADVNRLMTQIPKLGRFIVQSIVIALASIFTLLPYIVVVGVVAAAVSGVSLTQLEHIDREFKPAGVLVLSFGVLAMIPIVVCFTLLQQFATIELVYGDTQPMESLRRTFVLAKGFLLSIFGFAFIAGLVALVGFLACCVDDLPAVALSQLIMTGLYLALRNGSGLPPPPEP